MKKIIFFSSKHGGSEEVAHRLQKECPTFEVQELTIKSEFTPYDVIVFGCGVYAGMFDKTCKHLINTHYKILASKSVLMYTTGISLHTRDKEFKENISVEALPCIDYKDKLGGELNFPQFSFFEKKIIALVNKKGKFVDKAHMKERVSLFDEERINAFIKEMKNA